MKYIIETEMPLTEVYVAVSQEEFKKEMLLNSKTPYEWVYTDDCCFKPLPVSPMKEVGEEGWRDIAETNAEELKKSYETIEWYREKEKSLWKAFGDFCTAIKQQQEVQP